VAMSTLFAEASLLLGAAAPDAGVGDSAGCMWNVTAGKCCPGDSFMSVAHVNDTATCCALCDAHKSQGCTSFTLNKGESTCWLKTKARTSYSGDCDCGHYGPLPPDATPGQPHSKPHPANDSKILLYELIHCFKFMCLSCQHDQDTNHCVFAVVALGRLNDPRTAWCLLESFLCADIMLKQTLERYLRYPRHIPILWPSSRP